MDSSETTSILLVIMACFLLQQGFAKFEGAQTAGKFQAFGLIKSHLGFCVSGLTYCMFGYALAYGSKGAYMLADLPSEEYWHCFFNFVCAATIPAIATGAMADRVTLQACLASFFVFTGVLYPMASHWTWSRDGFLSQLGLIDHAGGGVLHAVGGAAALGGLFAIGPRSGTFRQDGSHVQRYQLSATQLFDGVGSLYCGLIAFHGAAGISHGGALPTTMAKIVVTTALGGCAGGVTALVYLGVVGDCTSPPLMKGMLAGTISVSSCCAVIPLWAAVFVVAPMGTISAVGGQKALQNLQLDDATGQAALHWGPGIISLLAVGFFGHPDMAKETYGLESFSSVVYGGSVVQLGIQGMGGLVLTMCGLATSFAFFTVLSVFRMLRISYDDELMGLDEVRCGGCAEQKMSGGPAQFSYVSKDD